ncbi:sensor histidine kinase [uncultured Psychroserpens sp.]|uniref:ATP-binding protein n=1 Tax=uncultured Psychroserpens sp. TaxID=255436 RepID=UPI0026164929|nr:sensor histidine kinase [uncultured Psychroserpens sp.]
MNKTNFKYYLFISASILLLADFSYAQNSTFESFYNAYDTEDYEFAEQRLAIIDTSKLTTYEKATWLYFKADCQFYLDKHHKAYRNILESKDLFESMDSVNDVSDANFLTISILSHQNNLKDRYKKINNIIDEEHKKAISRKDSNALRKIYHRIAADLLYRDNGSESIKYFKKVIDIAKEKNDSLNIAFALENIGTVHQTVFGNIDSAMYYTKKVVPVYKKLQDNNALFNNYNNQAEQYKQLKEYDEAIRLYLKADSIPLDKYEAKSKIILYENMSEAYELNKDFINSTYYLKKLDSLKGNVNDTKQNIAITEIKEQFDNEKLRAEKAESEARRLESEAKSRKNRNIAIGLGGSLTLGSIIAFLLFKNTKRKQKLAEQEKALETQKLATVLKEQELTAIDAMIEGQEKERQRIANDLHDDLGGLMATVKLHFNALKEKQTPELYSKTNQLIDEAYDKVRTVAHAKNSGVIAKQGLLKAIKDMADKVSVANKITIDVIDHGLENRLENSLELTIFRIVQELITNVIKHANANEVSIHITNHEDSLNIMVEDNGKGFNPSQITKTNKGMGISSIDKRVEHLEGSMTIESEKNQGTTIIIDIPL